MGQADGASHGDVVCEGRCPVCGRRVWLTWQRTGEADRCPCGVEAVLVVETRDLLKWYWRDPLNLPSTCDAVQLPAGSEALPAPPIQLRLV